MLPLLEKPKMVSPMRDVFSQQLDVAAEFGLSFLLTGLDDPTSPDWDAKLGYSPSGLAEANLALIEFLSDFAKGCQSQIP